MPKHPDFVKIYRQFLKRYCGSEDDECEKGRSVYYGWLNKMGLDDTKPYEQRQHAESCERFAWAQPHFTAIRQDRAAKYYQVDALFPLVSMNRNLYTEDELLRGARTLKGKPVNINHARYTLDAVSVRRAEYEDGCVEVLLRVSLMATYLGQRVVDLIDQGEIVHVSIEADCEAAPMVVADNEPSYGCVGLAFTGLALLTKDVLPGVPLTRIQPVERLVEGLVQVMQGDIDGLERREMSVKTGEDVQVDAKKAPCAHEAVIATLRLDVSEKKRELRGLQERLKAAEGRVRAKDAELAAKDTEAVTVKTQLERKIAELDESWRAKLQAREREMRDEAATLQARLEGTLAERDESWRAKLKTQSEAAATATAKLDGRIAELEDALRAERKATESALQTKDDENAAVKAKLESRVAELEELVQAKAERVDAAEGELQDANRKVAEAETRLSEARNHANEVAHRLETKTAALERVKQQYEDVVAERNSLATAVAGFEERLNGCEEAKFRFAQHNLELTTTLAARNDEILRLQDRVAELEQLLAKAKRHAKQVSKIHVKI